MKNKIIIHQVNGRIVHISASEETEIVLIESSPTRHVISKLEPDFQFETGKAHEIYSDQNTSEFLKKHEI